MRNIVIENVNELENNLQYYYNLTHKIEKDFGGPSIYFHIESIKELKSNLLSNRHIEMIYATLASWGMHRLGPPDETKTKLTDFTEFNNSILAFREVFNCLQSLDLRTISDDDLEHVLCKELKNIFYGLKVSISDSFLVANSKTMHHILPNLIPPIDRQYTVRFFYYMKSEFYNRNHKFKGIPLPSSIDDQYLYFCKILKNYKKIIANNFFTNIPIEVNSFNTSILKVLDNLIMAFIKYPSMVNGTT
jgi:hypothetical protein